VEEVHSTMPIDTSTVDGPIAAVTALALVEHATQKPVLVHASAIDALACTSVSITSNVKLTPSTLGERVWNELRPKGFVITSKGDGFVISRLPDLPSACPAAKDTATAAEKVDPAEVDREIRAGLKTVSPTERTMTLRARDLMLEHSDLMSRQLRIVPEQQNGVPHGLRIFGVRSDTIMALIGLENGDRIDAINGKDISSPEKALEVYSKLRLTRVIELDLTRRGAPMKLTIRLID